MRTKILRNERGISLLSIDKGISLLNIDYCFIDKKKKKKGKPPHRNPHKSAYGNPWH